MTTPAAEVCTPPGLEAPDATGPALGQDRREAWWSELCEELLSRACALGGDAIAGHQEALWQRGQQEIRSIRQMHAAHTHKMHGQLAAFAEAYRGLERENARLRSDLEALVKQLTLAGWQHPKAYPGRSAGLPQMPSAARCSGSVKEMFAPRASPIREELCEEDEEDDDDAASAGAEAEPAPEPALAGAPATAGVAPTPGSSAPCTPHNSPQPLQALDTPPKTLRPSAATLAAEAATGSKGISFQTFSFTLRRANDVQLGLEVEPVAGEECLRVKGVRPGGAVEAWNRQMEGDAREIRAGDRIVQVNGAEDASSMSNECVNKVLLRIVVARPAESIGAKA